MEPCQLVAEKLDNVAFAVPFRFHPHQFAARLAVTFTFMGRALYVAFAGFWTVTSNGSVVVVVVVSEPPPPPPP